MEVQVKSDIKRLLAAIKGGKADRTPNFEIWIGPRTIAHVFGKNDYAADFWSMPPAEAVELAKRIGQDAIVCSLAPALPPDGSILSEADLAAWAAKSPDLEGMRSKLKSYIAATEGTGLGVVLRIGGPLTQTYMSCGPIPIQSFMLMLYDQPELIDACMKLYSSWTLQMIEGVKDLPFHLFYIGDDLCDNSGPMIHPNMIAQVWAPVYKRIIAAARASARPVICHCCGKQDPVIPYWLEWGVEACHPLQSGANDIYAFKRKYAGRICPVGNISVGLLSSGTPAQVREDARRHIDELGLAGGYVLCSDHSIVDSVIPENFMAMIETAWAS